MAVIDKYWEDIHDIPTLSEAEEKLLAEKIAQGDDKAVDKLVTSNLRYVVALARQLSKDSEVSMDDLISEGNVAMLLAARRWNPSKDPNFVSYASQSVKKTMTAAIAQQSPMITLPKKEAAASKDMRRMSTDAPVHPGQTNTLGDMLKAGKPMTDDGAELSDDNYAITSAIAKLEEREQIIMKHFYGIGTDDTLTMAEIGEKLNLKRERIRQIRKTAERKMRRLMKHTLLLLVALMLGMPVMAQKGDGPARPPKFAKVLRQARQTDEDKSLRTIPQMYAYAVATSPQDSVVYITDLLILRNAQMTKGTNFLVGRQDLSAQFKNHLAGIDQPNRTCSTMFAVNYRKASKDYEKLKKNLTKKGFDIKVIDQTEFRFIVTH
jgi:RNA polymerase primary sigma factor